MKAERLVSGVIIFVVLFFVGSSICLGADIAVMPGDEASDPAPPLAVIQTLAPAVATQATPVVTYATVKETTTLDDSRTTYDSYEERKFGKQLDIQSDLKFPSLEDTESVAGENVLSEEAKATVSKEERVISLIEMQQELQEEKLILSKPIPLFVGGS